jgi:O-methyltransferase involved in polyketide biosynthesis
VTPYLEPETVLATLDAVVPFTAGGGGIVFDYSVPATSLSPERRRAFAVLSARVAAAGEPFRSAFEPSALRATLERIGFRTIDDLGPDELNARYFVGRTTGSPSWAAPIS